MSSTSMTVFADRLLQPYGQNKILWCWVATSKIVAENNAGLDIENGAVALEDLDGIHSFNGVPFYGTDSSNNLTADRIQSEIINHVMGSDKNLGGSPQDTLDALIFASLEGVDVGRYGEQRKTLTSSQLADIQLEVRQGRYVIGTMRNSTYTKGHAVVIKDYRASDDAYRIFDPWDLTDEYYPYEQIFSRYGFPTANSYFRIEFYTYCRP